MKSKFIIGEIMTQPMGLKIIAAVIFPECILHTDMSKVFVPDSIISAGFVAFNAEGKPFSYGESVSIGIVARGMKDQGLLEIALGMR